MQVMFSRGRGGLERVFFDHAELLARRGHIVHCVILDHAGYAEELNKLAAQSNGTIILHICPASGLHRMLFPWALRRLVKQIGPDIIVAHGAKVTSRLSQLRPQQVPLVAVTHNESPRLMKATHLIVLCEHLRKLFAARGFSPANMHVIPNCLPLCASNVPQRQQTTTDRILRIGTLSRLVSKKGVDIFLRGFRIALDRGLQAEAIIGGDGPLRADLQKLCHSLKLDAHVSFAGWVSDSSTFYADVDWICIPSRDEPFGLVALEGFAYGVPVIASAVGGLAEMITDGVNGVLFRSDDPESLAEALLKTYRQRDQIGKIREAAYVGLQRYMPEQIAMEIESALLTAIVDIQRDVAKEKTT
ncbi:glycosyltransferase family 4 protein [Stenotrophobium rhamnosiphilum]|uniref:Glycosyltransferase family 1 protein n=1 Tax=Stenotrophobium rhamnosiphilum TaxID=2029166 RepID=A0A2T5MKF0_9GAMM|nr:glycosyltransferase family 4 protein [Stenotrophobium rhamnosiphilum]PTU33063.1 hypothetical protein CJD38_02870 [Stenotrophobium rhamnosiphilum]